MSLQNIRIILSHPSHPGNIGAAARVMKNMALSRLYLINPAHFPNPLVTAMASGADDVLDNAVVVETLDDALKDCVWVVGTTARSRNRQKPVDDVRDAVSQIVEEAETGEVALLFGRENSGLSNEETSRCHQLLTIPTSPEFSSLNLASSVQILCYELFRAVNSSRTQEKKETPATQYASLEEMNYFYQHLERTLQEIDFYNPEQSPQMMHKLRKLFNRTRPDKNELNILRGMLTAMQKKL